MRKIYFSFLIIINFFLKSTKQNYEICECVYDQKIKYFSIMANSLNG